jgi:flagellar biosynthesis protein FlhG
MLDQATELRKLVLRSVRETVPDGSPTPPILVVCGGHGGVGVTTLAIHLSVALSGQGCRVVLVDADLHRPAVAAACGLSGDAGIADVLTARRDIHEVLQPGPGGVQVVAGRGSLGNAADWGEVAQQRLLRQLKKLGRHADLIALDAGSGGHEVMRRFWQVADQVVLVTTPDPLAVREAYATMKRLAGTDPVAVLRLLVNRVSDQNAAEEVHRRMCEASERFLELTVGLLGCVPSVAEFEAAGHAARACIMQDSQHPASLALDAMAARLVAGALRPVSVNRPRGTALAEARNSAGLTQPQAGFPPIDI